MLSTRLADIVFSGVEIAELAVLEANDCFKYLSEEGTTLWISGMLIRGSFYGERMESGRLKLIL